MKHFLLLLLLSACTAAHADRIDRTLTVDPNGSVRIDVVSGRVSIIGWDKPEVRVVGKVPNADNEFVFKTKGDDTRIEVESEHGFWGKHGSGHASLEIYCPANSRIRGDGASTEFDIKGITGSVSINTMSGDIDLQGGMGKVDLESVSGDVTVNDAKGKLNLASVSGDVIANASASLFDAQTVSGNITADVGATENVELESVSGDIDIKLKLADDGRLEADTVSGDIDILFTNSDINASFDIETGPGGDIRNQLSNHKSTNNFSMSGSLSFEIGNGKGQVNAETMSGTIKLEK